MDKVLFEDEVPSFRTQIEQGRELTSMEDTSGYMVWWNRMKLTSGLSHVYVIAGMTGG